MYIQSRPTQVPMAMCMATRLLLRTFRRPPPNPLRPPTSPPSSLLHSSLLPPQPPMPHTQVVQRLHTLPRALLPNIQLFRGVSQYTSSSKAAPPRRSTILKNMLSATFASTSAVAALRDLEAMKASPTTPHSVSALGSGAAILLHWDNGDEKNPPTRPHVEREKRPVTDALIALNLLVHAVDVLSNRTLLMWGNKNNDLIRKGQLWRLATPAVLHSGMIHIMCNMLFLDDIGSTMEEITGPRRFLAIYCTSGLAGNLLSYRFTRGNAIGASGALCGLIGAQAIYTWRRRESLTSSTDTFKEIAELILSSLAISLTLKLLKVPIRIDDWGHLGGLLGGAAVEWFLGPRGPEQHVARVGTTVFEERAPVLLH